MHFLVLETTLTQGSFRFKQVLREKERKPFLAHLRKMERHHVTMGDGTEICLRFSKGTRGCMCKPLSAGSCACLPVVSRAPSQRAMSNGRDSCCKDEMLEWVEASIVYSLGLQSRKLLQFLSRVFCRLHFTGTNWSWYGGPPGKAGC